MANFGAEPKCALRPLMSRVAMATRTAPGAGGLRVGASSSVLTSCRRRTAAMGCLPVKEWVQGLGRRLVARALEYVGRFEDQVARALIADPQLVLAAEPVENRKADTHQRNAEPLGGLTPVTVRDQKVRALRHRLEVAEVADLHALALHMLENLGVAGGRDRRLDLGAHADEEGRKPVKKVRLGGDGDLLARVVEVAVEQSVLQLRAAATKASRRGAARQLRQQGDKPVHRLHAVELAEEGVFDAGQLLDALSRLPHLLADRNA